MHPAPSTNDADVPIGSSPPPPETMPLFPVPVRPSSDPDDLLVVFERRGAIGGGIDPVGENTLGDVTLSECDVGETVPSSVSASDVDVDSGGSCLGLAATAAA